MKKVGTLKNYIFKNLPLWRQVY